MIVSKDNSGRIIGWMETYTSDREIVTVSVNGNINTISTRDRTAGKVESKTFWQTPVAVRIRLGKQVNTSWKGETHETCRNIRTSIES